MNFKLWLEAYEKYRDKVEQIAQGRNFVFKDWFPQERIYLPLETASETIESDDEVKDFLKELGYVQAL